MDTPKFGLKKQHDLTLWVHVVSILIPTFLPTLLHHPCSSFYIVMLREQINTERTHDSVIVRMNMGSSKTLGSWQHQKMCLPPCCRFANRARTTLCQPRRWWLQNSTRWWLDATGSDSVSVSNSCSNQRQIGKLGMICYCNILQHQ